MAQVHDSNAGRRGRRRAAASTGSKPPAGLQQGTGSAYPGDDPTVHVATQFAAHFSFACVEIPSAGAWPNRLGSRDLKNEFQYRQIPFKKYTYTFLA
ncbi:MAG: hypothetical protein WA012_01740 [Rhodoferax sp.]|jgi:hypothetical protein|uniref:hypothetical protein n=1 Tax=Rhodoferax sp. TaxID=50421 RepID=UPI003BB16D18